ncbi:MAG: DUF599 domain-containing protein [Thermoguttaceae bacterium]
MLPQDFEWPQAIAMGLILVCWFSYSQALARLGRGSLNSQLVVIRQHWLRAAARRTAKPFDAVLLGHIINSISFFGSATLIVLAGILSTFTGLREIHGTFIQLPFVAQSSLELFAIKMGFLSLVVTVCFFSFTYALRKLIYTIALIGALPDASDNCSTHDELVAAASTVLSQAITTFNFGIRGYYYAIAAVWLLVSPYASITATALVTGILFYRQLATPTALAIQNYVEAARSLPK